MADIIIRITYIINNIDAFRSETIKYIVVLVKGSSYVFHINVFTVVSRAIFHNYVHPI